MTVTTKKGGILLTLILALCGFSNASWSDFQPWKDYEVSESVWSVTTVRVHPNMGNDYIEGIARTWVESNKVFKELGQIEDYKIYWSDLPQSGDFNMMLVVKFADTESLAPSKAKYEAYMKKITRKMADQNSEFAQKNYPAMRDITGEYQMREITIK